MGKVKERSDLLALDNQGALFRILTSMAVDGIIVIDEVGSILFYNEACERLFQYGQTETIGQNIKILMPEPYRKEHDGYIARYRKTQERHVIGIGREVRGRRRDGSVFPMYLSVGEGTISGKSVFVGVLHDLSTLKSEKDRRSEADRHLADIVESSDDIIVSKTLDGIVTSWNPAAERIFGYSADEMVGRPLSTIIPEERQAEEEGILRRIRAGESIRHYETARRHRDGREILISLSVSPVRNNSGEVVGASKIARDITEQKSAQAKANQLQSELAHVARVSAVGQLSSALAHELNQPLSAIMNYVSAAKLRLMQPSADASKTTSLMDRALEQASRAGAIIQRLRAFLEKREPHRIEQDLNAAIQEAIALGFVGGPDENIKLALDLSTDLPHVEFDRVQIEQVIVNLLRNAGEAMKSSPVRQLTVSTYPIASNHVEIAIKDTGTGISPDVMAKLFEPFVTTKEKGMGVGLSICRTIIESHGGRILVAPNPSGGTLFKIQLPTRT